MSYKFTFVLVQIICLVNVSKSLETILTNLRISDYVQMNVEDMTVKLEFKFNAIQIESMRNKSDITSFKLTIRKFKSNETESILNKVFFIKDSYQTNNKITSVTGAIEHIDFNIHEKQSLNVTYDFMDMLKSINFNLKAHGLYILCIIFLNSNETIYLLRMPYENCFDIELKRVDENGRVIAEADETGRLEAHFAYYKPLFIPIMYILCALVFLVIIVWKDIIVKIRNKKIMLQKNNSIMKLINNLNSTAGIQTNKFGINRIHEKSHDSDASQPMLSETGPQIIVQNVSHFDTNEIRKSETAHDDTSEPKEATHILDMKPWKETKNSSPLADSRKKLNVSMVKIASNRDLAVHRSKATLNTITPMREQMLSRSFSYGSEERLQRKRDFRNYRATHSTEFLSNDQYSPKKPNFDILLEADDRLKSSYKSSFNNVTTKKSNVCYFYESNV